MNGMEFKNKIFNYIKTSIGENKNVISQFENYSKIYNSIIELDRYYDSSDNFYEQINNIIKDELSLPISLDSDEKKYSYVDKDSRKEIKLEELIYLKNKIHLKNENKEKKNNDIEEGKKPINDIDIMKNKCNTLNFFKDAISNLEVIIYEYMNILKTKGCNLPIKINVKIKNQNITYKLGDHTVDFAKIKKYLLNVKNDYIKQLEEAYKEQLNLRFLYGEQFMTVMKHLVHGLNIDPILRYILNYTDNNKNIKEGYKTAIDDIKDFINLYKNYNKNSLESISKYITTLFINNNTSFEKHYGSMKILSNETNKGIYLHECKSNAKEEFIINLFMDKLEELPIAQNVLITSNETSDEEIQAFFYRAILCQYNTLFVVEINDSFSDKQLSFMNTEIDNLLSYKSKLYCEETNEIVDQKKTQDYMNSCITFVCDIENTSFLKEIKKFNIQRFTKNYNSLNSLPDSQVFDALDKRLISKFDKIMVVSSDICGLGKSGEINRMINESNKKYFHFPLGGILNKSLIFKKLDNILTKIKREKYDYKDVAIHLDLTESSERSIINEFLFSFLITKFYTNNEKIIYIPNDIYIYIEIPNCFDDYISKFCFLKIFKRKNITIEEMPKFNFSKEIISIFKKMLEKIDSNEKIEEFVKKYIGIITYTFHQINIFVKLFISQYNQFKSKIKFLEDGKNVTERCIEEFAKCTRYFTNGGFAKLLTDKKNKNDGRDYIDKFSSAYDYDLSTMDFPSPLIFVI